MRDLNLLNQAWPNAVFGLRPRLFFLLIPYIHIFVLHRRFYERERPYHLTQAQKRGRRPAGPVSGLMAERAAAF